MLPTFIIDFDSTFITVEALDKLSVIALNKNPQKTKITRKISEITKAGMIGSIDFQESLIKRFDLFKPTVDDVSKLVDFLKNHITLSAMRNKKIFPKI